MPPLFPAEAERCRAYINVGNATRWPRALDQQPERASSIAKRGAWRVTAVTPALPAGDGVWAARAAAAAPRVPRRCVVARITVGACIVGRARRVSVPVKRTNGRRAGRDHLRTVTRGNHMGASSRLQRVATHLHSRASAPCSARSTGAAASASGRSGEFGLLEISAPSGIESAGRNDPLSRYVCTFCSPAQVFPHKTDTRSTSLS